MSQAAVPPMGRPPVVVTRPQPEADAWVAALCEKGWPALALPLLEVAEPTDPAEQEALAQARAGWWRFDALMFVSGAAVQHFFGDGRVALPPGVIHTRFWAPGPGTARALAKALAPIGIPPDRIDSPPPDAAQFDSEHLWPVVSGQMGPGRRLLIVRGRSAGAQAGELPGSGREWLLRQCQTAGAAVSACVAYERRVCPPDGASHAPWREAVRQGTVWLFSSSESLGALAPLAAEVDWARCTALVTHPRIGQAATALGFARVVDTRPALDDVLRTLESSTWTT